MDQLISVICLLLFCSSVSGVDVVFFLQYRDRFEGPTLVSSMFSLERRVYNRLGLDQAFRANGDSAIASERAEIEVVSGMTATVSLTGIESFGLAKVAR